MRLAGSVLVPALRTNWRDNLAGEALELDEKLADKKPEVLSYFRNRALEAISEGRATFGEANYKKRASAINRALSEERERLVAVLRQVAIRDGWDNEQLLKALLLVTYCANVLMLEARNSIWPYDYMAFSRRVGELWEPFCTLCFEHPVREDVSLFVPPLFAEVKDRLSKEIREFIERLPISAEQRATLLVYYDQVWSLVSSGEIQLACDLHFVIDKTRFVVDFKSGFGSNEKGNTNRLLLVGSVYRNIEPEHYRTIILVRAEEEKNNHYLQTLKNSGVWDVYCGPEAYDRIKEYSGFDLGGWLKENANWPIDLSEDAQTHFHANDLSKYLSW